MPPNKHFAPSPTPTASPSIGAVTGESEWEPLSSDPIDFAEQSHGRVGGRDDSLVLPHEIDVDEGSEDGGAGRQDESHVLLNESELDEGMEDDTRRLDRTLDVKDGHRLSAISPSLLPQFEIAPTVQLHHHSQNISSRRTCTIGSLRRQQQTPR